MTREIPGFYYDSAKRKYFRIEDSRTAPAQAAWSSENVKRRAVEQKEEKKRRERLRRAKGRVKRAAVRDVPLLGGLLAREAGEVGRGAAARQAGEELVRAWAAGLREKGSLTPWPWVTGGTITGLWVGGSGESSGPGVMFATAAGQCMAGHWIPRDADERISFATVSEQIIYRPRYLSEHVSTIIKFHEPSCSMLLTYVHESGVGIKRCEPHPGDLRNSSPAFLAERGSEYVQFDSRLDGGTASTINALQPAPRGSRLTCIAGTDKGIIQLQDNKLTFLTPLPPPPSRSNQRRRQQHADASRAPWQGDILSVDFAHHNPTEVILAGTRSSHICVLDLRVPPAKWTVRSNTFRHLSSVAHVRSTGPYEVLAAGPRSAMALYDIRFLQHHHTPPSIHQTEGESTVHQWQGNATRPIVTFPSYSNAAHIHTGLDVLLEPGYGNRGIVAAAHGDETVGLYSLSDGARLPAGAVDKIKADTVVRSMMWATLPGDRHPSLFVGEGSYVKKYSFWA